MTTLLGFVEQHMLACVLSMLWVLNIWSIYLFLRQRKVIKQLVNQPPEVESLMTKDEYNKARSYALDNNHFKIAAELYTEIIHTVLLLKYALYHYWDWSIGIANYMGISEQNDIVISAICMFIMNLVGSVLYLPFKVYYTFVLEEKHGFNKQKPLFFVKDQLLKFVVLHAIALPLLSCAIWIIKAMGDYFLIYLWVFLLVVSLFAMILYPEIIAPLFDKYSPLPEGELKKQIEALAASVNYPLYKLFIVEGSKRSAHSNAYMYGFHKHKRIVLYDTLVKEYYKPDKDDAKKNIGCETDEVVAVLAHELGHWKHSHTLKGFIFAQLHIIINFQIFAKLINYPPMYAAFGFTDSQPIFIGLIIVIMFILLPLNTIFNFIIIVISRKYEYEADKFAVTLGHGEPLKKALIKLQKDNLTFPVFDKLYSSWYHSHPSVLERLKAIDKQM